MSGVRCTACGSDELEPGFLEDQGGNKGYVRWIQGALQTGPLGGARRLARPRWRIEAHRCLNCSHLELFALRR